MCVRSSSVPRIACWKRLSIQVRNAARVLPDPVGAAMRTSLPEAMAGQLRSWTSVGEWNRSRNQDSTTGWNGGIDIEVMLARGKGKGCPGGGGKKIGALREHQ